ncbi:MAG: hypothetical protein VR70_05895 [Rhodospirillaceae bacterium BRH_c57]|nr:MAG: hypothetical protein VR70_05895 [Rhodospirillaceae bacterium BRH_c57]
MSHPRTSLSRHIQSGPTDDATLDAMRSAAWHQQGVVMLRLDEVACEWTRQAVENHMAARYGKRRGG